MQKGVLHIRNLFDSKLGINSYDVALCKLNNKYFELYKTIEKDGDLELIEFNSTIGYKIYTRTLQFIFIKAALDLFKESTITIEHTLSDGVFGELHKEEALNEEEYMSLRQK